MTAFLRRPRPRSATAASRRDATFNPSRRMSAQGRTGAFKALFVNGRSSRLCHIPSTTGFFGQGYRRGRLKRPAGRDWESQSSWKDWRNDNGCAPPQPPTVDPPTGLAAEGFFARFLGRDRKRRRQGVECRARSGWGGARSGSGGPCAPPVSASPRERSSLRLANAKFDGDAAIPGAKTAEEGRQRQTARRAADAQVARHFAERAQYVPWVHGHPYENV